MNVQYYVEYYKKIHIILHMNKKIYIIFHIYIFFNKKIYIIFHFMWNIIYMEYYIWGGYG